MTKIHRGVLLKRENRIFALDISNAFRLDLSIETVSGALDHRVSSHYLADATDPWLFFEVWHRSRKAGWREVMLLILDVNIEFLNAVVS